MTIFGVSSEIVVGVFAAAALIAATSFSGAILTARAFRKSFKHNQALLVSFAAGVFLVAGWGLLTEAWELIRSSAEFFAYFGGSVVVFHLLSLVWPEHHYHREGDECHNCKPKSGTARRMLVGDSVHNIVDGMLLVPAFFIGFEFGIATVVAIWLHEVVQEVSEFIVFKEAGYSTRKALRLNALTSLTIFIGAGVALFALDAVHDLEGPLLAIAAGAFLYIALKDLVPHSVRHSRSSRRFLAHIIVFLLGLGLMFGVGMLDSHSHGIDGHDHGEYHEHEAIQPSSGNEVEEVHQGEDHHDHDHL